MVDRDLFIYLFIVLLYTFFFISVALDNYIQKKMPGK